jgi:hypothetical protein
MIVNPQFFNYRLIIGSLIVAIAILGVFSFTNYETIKSHQTFLDQEKQLVESELSEMIKRYDAVGETNNTLSSQLAIAKKDLQASLDSLRFLKNDISVILKYKQQLSNLKAKNDVLFKSFDSILEVNNSLEKDNLLAHNQLNEQIKANSALQSANESLNNSVKKGALLTANSFKAKAYKSFLGKNNVTNKAAQAQIIEVCFALAENSLTEKGQKDIYIQILNPKNNVVADKGEMKFGTTSLIYSDKQVIDYNNKVVDVCVMIDGDTDDIPFTKGTYFVSIFHKDRKLGSTQIELN